MLKIEKIETNDSFKWAEEFLLPFERENCSLMSKIIGREENLYMLHDYQTLVRKDIPVGVFSFSRGNAIICYLNKSNLRIKRAIIRFFKDKEIFSINGDNPSVRLFEDFLSDKLKGKKKDIRDMYLMEYGGFQEIDETEIYECSLDDVDLLMDLQIGFSIEEQNPVYRKSKVMPAAERMAIERVLRKFSIYSVRRENQILSKAQLNAISRNWIQIGGVYTRPEFRNKGMAKSLVQYIGNHAVKENKKAVLFVRKENFPAVAAYESAGFRICGEHRCVYVYDEESVEL